MTSTEQQHRRSRLSNPAVLVPELKEIAGALFRATGNGSVPEVTISLLQLCAGQIVGNTYLTGLHTGNLRKALATLIMAIGQVCFFIPLALIGKPLPGVSPTEQWRQ
ncbi:hypothetical protein ACNF49_01730 [Actinomadura sp. ATCC 39365]